MFLRPTVRRSQSTPILRRVVAGVMLGIFFVGSASGLSATAAAHCSHGAVGGGTKAPADHAGAHSGHAAEAHGGSPESTSESAHQAHAHASVGASTVSPQCDHCPAETCATNPICGASSSALGSIAPGGVSLTATPMRTSSILEAAPADRVDAVRQRPPKSGIERH